MGNSLGGKRRSAKVMKINGETFRLRAPVRAESVLENHPGHVLLESEAVKNYGVGAKPLEPQQELKPKRLYFLVQLPKYPEDQKLARRASSGIQMNARERLESLMLARRAASDLSTMRPVGANLEGNKVPENGGGVRFQLKLPKAEVERLMAESKDGVEMAEKIVSLYGAGGGAAERSVHWNGDRGLSNQAPKPRQKRVGFLPINEGEIRPAAVAV